jgi:hypothetical protein
LLDGLREPQTIASRGGRGRNGGERRRKDHPIFHGIPSIIRP